MTLVVAFDLSEPWLPHLSDDGAPFPWLSQSMAPPATTTTCLVSCYEWLPLPPVCPVRTGGRVARL